MYTYSYLKSKLIELDEEINQIHAKVCVSKILINDKNACRNRLTKLVTHFINMMESSTFTNEFKKKLSMLFIIKRAIHLPHGYGYKTVSHWLFIILHSYYPDIMERLLYELPNFGCWNDFNSIYKIIYEDLQYYINFSTNKPYIQYLMSQRLRGKILQIWCEGLSADEYRLNYSQLTSTNFSYLAKWIPKEKRSLDKDTKVVNDIVNYYYPNDSMRLGKTKYRKLVSKLNKLITTTEVSMCSKQYSQINFTNVPKKCLVKNEKAWMDQTVNGKRRNIQLLDRTIARYNYLDYVNNINNAPHISKSDINQPILLTLLHPAYIYYKEIINRMLE